jgi:large subunit ribosomal protein L32
MAHPKRRHSVSRKHMRQAHDFIISPHLGQCPKCGQQTRSHQVCGYCGYYRGVEVIKMQAEEAPPAAGEKK